MFLRVFGDGFVCLVWFEVKGSFTYYLGGGGAIEYHALVCNMVSYRDIKGIWRYVFAIVKFVLIV